MAVLDLIAVDPNYRGQKIGATIVNELLKFVVKKKNDSTMLIASPQGLKLYEKYGFKVQDYWTQEFMFDE